MNANSDKDYIDAKAEAFSAKVEVANAKLEAVNAKTEAMRASMAGRLDAYQENVNGRFAEIIARIDMRSAELRTEIADNTARVVQWMVGLFIASMAIFITVVTFVLNNAVPKVAPAAPPVIIQVTPQGVTVSPPGAAAMPRR